MLKRRWATKGFKHKFFEFEPLESVTLPDLRLYKTPTGKIYPSVTTQLGAMNKHIIDKWKARVGEAEAARIVKLATDKGTRMHNILEKYILNDDQYLKGAFPTDIDNFKKIQRILDEKVTTIYGNEFPLYSDYLFCAGRCDLLCDYNGSLAVVDFKTASKEKTEDQITSYMMQATAYCIMIGELKNVWVNDFHIIIASPENHASVYSGKVNEWYDRTVDFFQNQYDINQHTQEFLTEKFNNVS